MEDEICVELNYYDNEDLNVLKKMAECMKKGDKLDVSITRVDDKVRVCGKKLAISAFAERGYLVKAHIEEFIVNTNKKLPKGLHWIKLTKGYGVFEGEG